MLCEEVVSSRAHGNIEKKTVENILPVVNCLVSSLKGKKLYNFAKGKTWANGLKMRQRRGW